MENTLVQRQPSNKTDSTVREKIMSFLSRQTGPLTPRQIAKNTGLNRHSVRRELQKMLEKGIARKNENHGYVLASVETPTQQMTSTRTPLLKAPEKTRPTSPRDVADMPERSAFNLPKVKINEILFVAYTTPAPMTRTAPLDERETVIYRVLPEDLAEKLKELESGLDTKVSKCLKTVVKGRLYFVRHPIEKYKPLLQSVVEEWNKKYAEFADEVFSRQEELGKAIRDFYERHKVTRDTPELTREYLHERFRVNSLMIPFSLRSGLVSEVMSEEEWRHITEEVKERVAQAYRESMNHQLDEFFASLKDYAARLSKGKMVNARSLTKLHRLYNEALEGLSITQDTRYEATFDVMGKLLNEFESGHERHKSVKRDKMLAATIVAATLNATKAITRKAQPTLEEFQTILDAEKRPTGKKREGLREVIEGLTLPTVS